MGDNVRDTIEMLEAIGRDALLRHASPDVLAEVLADAEVSDGLRAAIVLGDPAPLTEELGILRMQTQHSTQFPGHDDDHDGDDDGDDDDGDDGDDEDGERKDKLVPRPAPPRQSLSPQP